MTSYPFSLITRIFFHYLFLGDKRSAWRFSRSSILTKKILFGAQFRIRAFVAITSIVCDVFFKEQNKMSNVFQLPFFLKIQIKSLHFYSEYP